MSRGNSPTTWRRLLPRGYSVASVAQAITKLLLAKRTPEWMRAEASAS